jgi:hypothetical protein
VTATTDGSATDVCVAQQFLGTACTANAQCFSGYCKDSACAPPNYCELSD